ncbi:hypothetical protein [Jeongeupia naejangsanensis]|uniref:DUF3325 domain-containing protein n=1 Tax=Jeongeupia naejangsanensis TaxID=613195 RepID=A0ABS2BQ04_9NEIS|nr:hypothetical protein [Jeongeupia naejangsanensis]MBM3117490.1 hypothetical protein [Jeongeupia naejangsanensis]
MSALAFLLCLSAAACIYLASPHQQLLPEARCARRLRGLAVALVLAGTGVWMHAADVASGLVAAMLVVMTASVALPYLGLLLPSRASR